MSKFTTTIPTGTADFIATLPKTSYIYGVLLVQPLTEDNRADIAAGKIKQSVQVFWENPKWETGLTVPVEFSASDVKAGVLPKSAKVLPVKPAAATPPKPAATAPPVKPPVYMTEAEVNAALADGKTVEYMGVQPVWKQFEPKSDHYTEGYFYRLRQKPLDGKPKGA